MTKSGRSVYVGSSARHEMKEQEAQLPQRQRASTVITRFKVIQGR